MLCVLQFGLVKTLVSYTEMWLQQEQITFKENIFIHVDVDKRLLCFGNITEMVTYGRITENIFIHFYTCTVCKLYQ